LGSRGVRARYAARELLRRLAVLAAVLRLGTKYGVTYLRDVAVARLVELFPHEFEAYFAREQDEWPYEESCEEGALIFIILARECNIPAVLPCCLFALTPDFGDDISKLTVGAACTLEDGRTYELDPDTYSLCIRAGWRLSDLRQRLISDALSTVLCVGPSCRDARTMTREKEQLLRSPTLSEGSLMRLLEPIDSHWWVREFKLCDRCGNVAAAIWKLGQLKTWDQLPEYYGLAPWDELVAASQLPADS
jgi:hypothetical protein